MTKALIALGVAVAVGGMLTRTTSVVVSGTARDCFQESKLYVPDLEVSAFNPSTNRRLDSLLSSMGSIDLSEADSVTHARFNDGYFQVLQVIKDSVALARDTTDVAGRFALTFPPLDSVIVVGQLDREDEPYYYRYKKIGGLTNTTLLLDMSGGRCGF